MANFLKNLAKGTLSASEIKETVQQLKVSEEKVYFGVEITQRNRGFDNKVDFINQKYILIISSNLSGTRKNLQKNSKTIDITNFSNIIILLQDLKEFLMQNYGLEIFLPDNIPLCEVKLDIKVLQVGDITYNLTKHLNLSIKNNNNYPLKILKLGIKSGSMSFNNDEEPIIEPMDTYNYQLIPYEVFKKQLKDANVEKPYLLKGYAELDTGEVFFTKEVEL